MTDYTKIPLVFNVYKPVGRPSFHPVYIFRKFLNYNFNKIGHFGTLDPFAEGVLLIGVQGAQKMNDYIHQYMTKTYEGHGLFGIKTSSGDLLTNIIEEKEIEQEIQKLSAAEMEEIIGENFLGEYWQSPHVVSAAKYKGRRLYKLALEGKFVVLEKRKRDIKSVKILEYNYPEIKFSIEVSSGTYIRSFFEDVATMFGGVGTLKKLVRTKIGEFSVASSIEEENWPSLESKFDLVKHGITIDRLFALNAYHLEPFSANLFMKGQRCPVKKALFVPNEKANSQNIFWLYSENELLGMCKVENERISTVFNLPCAIERYS
jgi:tRNA pseudouridine55 synthase